MKEVGMKHSQCFILDPAHPDTNVLLSGDFHVAFRF